MPWGSPGWPSPGRAKRDFRDAANAAPALSQRGLPQRPTFAEVSEGARQPHTASAAPRSESLPRARIIRRRTVFDATRNQGRRVSNRHMVLNFIARDALPPGGETGSVAFLTPKRLGPATVRNKLRRRMREIYRRELARPEESAYLVWIARPPAVELSFDELKKTMRSLREKMR